MKLSICEHTLFAGNDPIVGVKVEEGRRMLPDRPEIGIIEK